MVSNVTSDPAFWGFAIPVVILIILGWIAAFVGGGTNGHWHQRGHHWDKAPFNIVGLIVWTIALLLFAWAAYKVDGAVLTQTQRMFLRTWFGFAIVFGFLFVILLYFFHQMAFAIVALIFLFIILVGLIIQYSFISISAAWMTFILLVVSIFMLHTLSSSIERNMAAYGTEKVMATIV